MGSWAPYRIHHPAFFPPLTPVGSLALFPIVQGSTTPGVLFFHVTVVPGNSVHMDFLKDSIYLFTYFREKGREGERERNIDVREKHQFGYLSYTPQLGAESTTQGIELECALTRNRTGNFSLCRMMPNQLNRTSQGCACGF